MKGLSIKKLAAIATGAALVGTALAPIASALSLSELTNSDIYDSGGSPSVSIVVGSLANVSDVVWAGNIAAKIAEKASTTGTCTASASGTCGEDYVATCDDITAKLTMGGTVTFENAKTFKTVDLNSATPHSDTNNEVPKTSISQTGGLDHLAYGTTTFKWNGTTYQRLFKETIGVNIDAKFDYEMASIQDLVAYMDSYGDFNYVLDLGDGIPAYTSLTSAAAFTDGTDDHVVIPFFGEDYVVYSVDATSSPTHIRLLRSAGKESYSEGDTITGLTGKNDYDGQELTVEFSDVRQEGAATVTYKALFRLYDEEGNLAAEELVSSGEYLDDALMVNGNEVLGTQVYIDSIGVSPTKATGEVFVLRGENIVELYDDRGYPYDSTATSYDWRANITVDGNYLKTISIKNDAVLWNYQNPIYATTGALTDTTDKTTEAVFLGGTGDIGEGYASVLFNGFEQDESITSVKIGADCEKNSYSSTCLTYYDTLDTKHEVPFLIDLPIVSTGSFSFDGKTIYYATSGGGTGNTVDFNLTTGTAVNLNGIDLNLYTGNDVASDGYDYNFSTLTNHSFQDGSSADVNILGDNQVIDINGVNFTVVDANADATCGIASDGNCATKVITVRSDGNIAFAKTSFTSSPSEFYEYTNQLNHSFYYDDLNALQGAYEDAPVQLTGIGDTQTYNYALFADEARNHIYLLLDSSTNFAVQYNKDIAFLGTDTGENGMMVGIDSNTYYIPDTSLYGNLYSSSDTAFNIATISLDADEDGTYDANVYVDTADGKLVDYPNNNLSTYSSDVNYNYASADATFASIWAMDDYADSTSQPNKAYDDFGTKYTISDGVLTVAIPENRPKPVIVVKGSGTTSVASGGETSDYLAEGATWETDAGTKITISELVVGTATCAGEAGGEVTCTASPSTYTMPASVDRLVYLDKDAPAGKRVIVGGPVVNTLAAQVPGLKDRLTASGVYMAEIDDVSGDIIVAGYHKEDTAMAAQELIDAIDALA